MSAPDKTPKPPGSRMPNPRRLPEQLRRNAVQKRPVPAQQPGFWPFGPPEPGKGPKPIRYRPPTDEAADEPPTGEAADGPEAHY